MSQFSYKAVDRGGGHVKGTIEAVDRRSAGAVLADKGHFVTELLEKDGAVGIASFTKSGEKISLGVTYAQYSRNKGKPLFSKLLN